MGSTIKLSPFMYHPFHFEERGHAIEKSDDKSVKHRYLKGITSGTRIDGHGERLTDECIRDLQAQGKAGTVLLYADRHGVAYTEDIGILVDSQITPEGDWVCEFRLYDASDSVPQACLDTIEKLWKQINGLPPYKTPLQKGFSIEGYIPDNGILSQDAEGRRVINKIVLDGAVVVPRPAYQSSIANSIMKTLGENSPWVQEKIQKSAQTTFKSQIATEELQDNYFKYNYKYQDKLEDLVQKVMTEPSIRDKKDGLSKVFKEYTEAMIELILQSTSMFENSGRVPQSDDFRYLYTPSANGRMEILKSLSANVDELINTITKEV